MQWLKANPTEFLQFVHTQIDLNLCKNVLCSSELGLQCSKSEQVAFEKKYKKNHAVK